MSTAAMGSASAVCATEHFNPEGYETYRYYFYMPDDWYNEYAESAGIYWWSGDGAPETWTGYVAEKSDISNLYYCDVPTSVTTIIWNNTVDGGTDSDELITHCGAQTVNIPSEYYEEGDSDLYFEGLFYANGEPKLNFDNMVYVVDSEKVVISTDLINKGSIIAGGEWYYYYGDGKYGTEPTLEMALENGGYYNQPYCTPGVTPKKDGYKLTVNTESNVFPKISAEYSSNDTVTINYYVNTESHLENFEWSLKYDNEILTPVYTSGKKLCPNIVGGLANLANLGTIKYVFSQVEQLDEYSDFVNNSKQLLITCTFKINQDKLQNNDLSTNIKLNVKNMTLADFDKESGNVVVDTQKILVRQSKITDNILSLKYMASELKDNIVEASGGSLSEFTYGDFVCYYDYDGVAIKSYKGIDEFVLIPEIINNQPVVKIDNNAFANSKIIGVYIPYNIKRIYNLAFNSCDNLHFVFYGKSPYEYNDITFIGGNNNLKVNHIEYNVTPSENLVIKATVEPTCQKDGYDSYICSVCKYSYNYNYKSKVDHNLKIDTYSPSSCKKKGYKVEKCTYCYEYFYNEIPYSAHCFEDNFCIGCNINIYDYAKSEHNYNSNENRDWELCLKNAHSINLTFSKNTNFESDYDYLYIYDKNDILVGKYTSNQLAGKTITVNGNYVKLNLKSDSSINSYGFELADVNIELLGDANNDGIINVTDITEIQSYIAGISRKSDIDTEIMDTDNNGVVNIKDATTIQKYLCQLINELG